VGPISASEFQSLAADGTIGPDTLVLSEDMEDCQPYAVVSAGAAASQNPPPIPDIPTEDMKACAECNGWFSENEMVQYKDSWICAACKPLFFQRVREGGSLNMHFHYAGFWMRFVARLVDGLFIGSINAIIAFCLSVAFNSSFLEELFGGKTSLIQLPIEVIYTTYFLGAYGATLGKMACGIWIVRPDGQRISYWRAFARYFAAILSQIILFLGFIIAAFDDEKRALHDRICDTRVVYK
jgi:uncharacterized RDD family membrane protein YckC